jgi:outer membrane protein OmpA-like peptidoglycan-associated protein
MDIKKFKKSNKNFTYYYLKSSKSMKKLNLLFIIMLLGITFQLTAQTKERPWAIGLYGVKTEYLGDMKDYYDRNTTSNWFNYRKNTVYNFDMLYGGGAISFDRYLSRFFDLGIYGSFGTIGYDSFDEGTATRRNFKSNLGNVNLHTRFKFLGQNDARLVPYITLGAGGIGYLDASREVNEAGNYFIGSDRNIPFHKEKADKSSNFAGILTGGIGLELKLTDVVGLRYQVDFGWTTADKYDFFVGGKHNDCQLQHSLGIVVNFGKGKRDQDKDGVYDDFDKCPNTPKGVKVDTNGCPIDSDGDGVPDYLDKCPNTPQGAPVDANGCPIDSDGDNVPDYLDKCPNTPQGIEVDANGCPIDSDGDNVPDYLDKCPDTPKGVKVDTNGCPIDSDGDGVSDYLDKCPNTPKGVEVDENGCPVAILPEITQHVYFDTGKYTIKSESYPVLDQIVEILKSIPGSIVTIEGHTDNTGSTELNQRLSINRANAVRDYLIKKGIDKNSITAKGFGRDKPVADNATVEGRSKNRRVEFLLKMKD